MVNGFRFHTHTYGSTKSTANWGVCVKGDTGSSGGFDFYGIVDDIIEIQYSGAKPNFVTLFKCTWFDPTRGVRTHTTSGLVYVKWKSRLSPPDPFILARQAQQVYYTQYPHPSLQQW